MLHCMVCGLFYVGKEEDMGTCIIIIITTIITIIITIVILWLKRDLGFAMCIH